MKGLKIVSIIALGCAGVAVLYAASWVLYFAHFRESDVSDRGYYSLVWIIYVAGAVWLGMIGRWLFNIGRAGDE